MATNDFITQLHSLDLGKNVKLTLYAEDVLIHFINGVLLEQKSEVIKQIVDLGNKNVGLHWNNPDYDRSNLSLMGHSYANALSELMKVIKNI